MQKKKAFPVSLEEEMIEWVMSQVDNERYRNRSHVVEQAILEFKRRWKE